MVDIIAEMNRKTDLALGRIVEIAEIIEKQKQLKNTMLIWNRAWCLLMSPSELCLYKLPLKKKRRCEWIDEDF